MQVEKDAYSEIKRRDNIIPDYDHLFDESINEKGIKKTRAFSKLLRLNVKSIILTTLIYFIQAAPVWLIPLVTAYIINITTETVTAGVGATAGIWRKLIIATLILIISIVQNIPTTILRYNMVSKVCRKTGASIKSAVVRKLQSLSITYHKDMQTGKVQAKFLKDTDTVESLFSTFLHHIIPSFIGVVVATIISVSKNLTVSLFFLCVIPINVLLSYAFRKKLRKVYRDHRVNTEKMSAKLSTMIEMVPVTKSHGLERQEIESVDRSILRLVKSGRNMDKNVAAFGSASFAINEVLRGVNLVFCAILALKKIISVGDIVLYQSMFAQISSSVSGLINVYPQLSSGIDAINSISEIMNEKDVEVAIGKANVPEVRGDVEFKNLCYKYPNTEQWVVKDFSLSVKAGECVAVVGASGSGKSTIMNLIIGLFIAEQGELLIDGKPITDFNLSEYRHHVSVVPQNSLLFDGSIRENITYGLTQYTEEDLERVIEMANIKEFLGELPNGIDTHIGEHGGKLSGGQRQRITIARALIRNPKILILDEATSALDNISEYHVQKAISSSIRGRTTFIVAHRLSTIRNADRIVVMEQGVAVESGTYEELMAKKGKFYELKCLNEINAKQAEDALGGAM